MRRLDTRIERLEYKIGLAMPSRITSDWLLRQPESRMQQVLEKLPIEDLDRIEKELKAEIEEIDAPVSTPT